MTRKRSTVRLLLLVQSGFILIAFNKFFAHPLNYMFKNFGDGLKNYFTFYSYLHPSNTSFSKIEQMNFPFGEYIFYTDNTPLLAFPLKLFSTYFFDISPYSITIFNGLCIFSILLSTYYLYKILYRLLRERWLIFIFSIMLVWVNPQTLRFEAGHANLGFSCILLICIWLLIRFFDEYKDSSYKAFTKGISISIFIIFASMVHFYYAALLCVFVSLVFLAWGISTYKTPGSALSRALNGVAISLASLFFLVLFMKSIDQYYEFRKAVPEGYDFGGWKMKVRSLFTAGLHNAIQTPLSQKGLGLESRGYLGSFNLFGIIAFLVLIALYYKNNRLGKLKEYFSKDRAESMWILYFLFAGFFCLMIALGETLVITPSLRVTNYLNPFYYLGFLSEDIKQFRCLGRFGWFFFWSFSFLVLFIADRYWRYTHNYYVHLVIVFFILLAVSDTFDIISYQNHKHYENNLTIKKHRLEAENLAEQIDVKDYQAILPVPFFHVGSENYDYTIDPDEEFFSFCAQLSTITGLPLMASRMSRTAEYQAKDQLATFIEPEMVPSMRELMNEEQHILVLYNEKLATEGKWYRGGGFQPAKSVALHGQHIIKYYRMRRKARQGDYELYRFNLRYNKY